MRGTTAHAQRRFRDRAEREAIRAEILATAEQQPGLTTAEGFAAFEAVLARFVESTDAAFTFSGSVPLPHADASIHYVLPGRRIERHVVRVARDGNGA